MRRVEWPPIQPTPLKGTLKKEDIIRAIEAARAKRLKEDAEKAARRPASK